MVFARLSHVPFIPFLFCQRSIEILIVVHIIQDSAFWRSGFFGVLEFFSETASIETDRDLLNPFRNLHFSSVDHTMFYHVLCDTVPERSSTTHSRDILHRGGIIIPNPYSDNRTWMIGNHPIISEIGTCSSLHWKGNRSAEDARDSEGFCSVSRISEYLFDEENIFVFGIE